LEQVFSMGKIPWGGGGGHSQISQAAGDFFSKKKKIKKLENFNFWEKINEKYLVEFIVGKHIPSKNSPNHFYSKNDIILSGNFVKISLIFSKGHKISH